MMIITLQFSNFDLTMHKFLNTTLHDVGPTMFAGTFDVRNTKYVPRIIYHTGNVMCDVDIS